jgi:hypothetical protein
MLSGVCKICGCSDGRSCVIDLYGELLCEWIDDGHTLCSACLPKLPEKELSDLAMADMKTLHGMGLDLALPLTPIEAFCLQSGLQLALRHPALETGETASAQVLGLIRTRLAEFFEASPAIAELIRRGGDPSFDIKMAHVAEPKSSLILP